MKFPAILVAMAGFAAAALIGVLARPLLPVDETRYLAVAWEMRLSGDWLVPRLNGDLYAHKPPLLFWLINLVWSAFGVSEFAARLVGPAFGVAAIGETGVLARRLWPDDAAVGGRAALALAGFAAFGLFAGMTMFDAMLTLAVVLGALALVETARTPWAWFGFGAALAFGAFAKGPVVLIFLVPLALLTPLWNETRVTEMLKGFAVALAVGLGLIGLWLVPAIVAGGPEYRAAVLWSQHAGRVTDSFAHVRPWWFFPALLPLLLWPWAWSAGVWRRVGRIDRADRGLRLCALWALSALALFSLISGKQAHYLLPALPAAALVAARALGRDPVPAPLAALVPGLLGLALVALALGVAPTEEIAAIASPAWAMGLIGLLLLGLAAATLRLRGAALAASGLALPAVAALVFALGAPGTLYDARPIGRLLAQGDATGVATLGGYRGEFTFAGRLTNPVRTLDGPAEGLAWLDGEVGRVLFARLDQRHPDADPSARFLYRNRPYGIWISGSAAPAATAPTGASS